MGNEEEREGLYQRSPLISCLLRGNRLRDRLLKLSPDEFERLVGKLLESIAMAKVQVIGRTHDGGIDGNAEIPDKGLKIAFQAKRWQEKKAVGVKVVREFIGAMTVEKYDGGIFITTSRFTDTVIEEVMKLDSRNCWKCRPRRWWAHDIPFEGATHPKIVLKGMLELINLMMQKGLGVKRVPDPFGLEEVDEDFFKNLSS